jgi:hypothetical protein
MCCDLNQSQFAPGCCYKSLYNLSKEGQVGIVNMFENLKKFWELHML